MLPPLPDVKEVQARLQAIFPQGSPRRNYCVREMEAGPSSVITKAVVEVFGKRFLGDPPVLWISESGNKVVQRGDTLAADLGFKIESNRVLPDRILVDWRPPSRRWCSSKRSRRTVR